MIPSKRAGLRSQPQRVVRLRRGATINERMVLFVVPSVERDLVSGKPWTRMNGLIDLFDQGYGFSGSTGNQSGAVDLGGYPVDTKKDWSMIARVYFSGSSGMVFGDASAIASGSNNCLYIAADGTLGGSTLNNSSFVPFSGSLPTLTVGWHDLGIGVVYNNPDSFNPVMYVDGKRYVGPSSTVANFGGPIPRMLSYGGYTGIGLPNAKCPFFVWWQRSISEGESKKILENPYGGFAANSVYYDETVTLAGSLSGAYTGTDTPINLTSVGTLDWVHFLAGGYIRKSGGGSKFGTITAPSGTNSYNDDKSTLTWTDGTPTASGSDTSGIWSTGQMSFTVDVSSTPRKVSVYTGRFNCSSRITATLSDGSAPPISVDTPQLTGGTNGSANAEFIVASGSPTATLTISISMLVNTNGGNVTLRGAALGPAVAAADLSGNITGKSTLSTDLGSWPVGSWVTYGNENSSATVAANTLVRYGANGFWVERVMSGTFTFNNATFGDPIGGTAKVGQIWTATATATAAALGGTLGTISTLSGVLSSPAVALGGSVAGKSTLSGSLSSTGVSLGGSITAKSTLSGSLSGSAAALGGSMGTISTLSGTLSSPAVSFSGALAGRATLSGTLSTSSLALAGTLASRSTLSGTLNYGGTTNRRRMFLGM